MGFTSFPTAWYIDTSMLPGTQPEFLALHPSYVLVHSRHARRIPLLEMLLVTSSGDIQTVIHDELSLDRNGVRM